MVNVFFRVDSSAHLIDNYGDVTVDDDDNREGDANGHRTSTNYNDIPFDYASTTIEPG